MTQPQTATHPTYQGRRCHGKRCADHAKVPQAKPGEHRGKAVSREAPAILCAGRHCYQYELGKHYAHHRPPEAEDRRRLVRINPWILALGICYLLMLAWLISTLGTDATCSATYPC